MKTRLLKLTRNKVYLEKMRDDCFKINTPLRKSKEVFSSIDKERNVRDAKKSLILARIEYARVMSTPKKRIINILTKR